MSTVAADIVQVHPFRFNKGAVEHLLLLRSPDVEFRPSIWQILTGRSLPAERGATTARRELREETGLDADQWYALPDPALFYFEPTDQIVLSPIFACRIAEGRLVTLSQEHVESCWLNADDALSRLIFPSHVQGVRAVERLVRDPEAFRIYRLTE